MQNQSEPNGIFTAAAALNLRVFPVMHRGKRPAVPSWKEYADRAPTPEELAAWDEATYNLGIICGAVSGIFVVDADSQAAIDYLEGLALPPTPTVRTAKGLHLYFRYPGLRVGNPVRVGGLEIDIRGDGGYVVGAGSLHESGHKYEWTISPTDVPFAAAPQAILDLLVGDSSRGEGVKVCGSADIEIPTEPGIERFLAIRLGEACAAVAKAEEGSRNKTLNAEAFTLAKHVAAAGVEWEPFASALAEAARKAGLDDGGTQATLDSARKAGFENPTPWVTVAKDYVYLGHQDVFQHRYSGTTLKRAGFNGSFGHTVEGSGLFTNFLLDCGYITKVHDIIYLPSEPTGFVDRDGLSYWNVYRPSDVIAEPGDAAPFTEFMEYLIPEREERDHVLKMMAFTVRNPGQRMRHALLLRSRVHGVGKSLLVDGVWGSLLGRHNVTKTSSRELTSPFQSWAKENLMVVVEELNIGAGLSTYNELKDIITSDRARINEKFLVPRYWDVFSTFVFISNLEVPLIIEATDRRFCVIDTPAEKREPSYYASLVKWIDENLGVIRAHLDEIDLSSFDPHAPPPMTPAKEALIQRSCSPLAQELAHHIQERSFGFRQDVLTINQMRGALSGPATSHHLIGRALRELGAVHLGQTRVGADRPQLWAVRNTRYWECASPSERAAENQQGEGGRFFDWPWFIGILPACDWPGERSFDEEFSQG